MLWQHALSVAVVCAGLASAALMNPLAIRQLPDTGLPTDGLPTTDLVPTSALPTDGSPTTVAPISGLPTTELPTGGIATTGLPSNTIIQPTIPSLTSSGPTPTLLAQMNCPNPVFMAAFANLPDIGFFCPWYMYLNPETRTLRYDYPGPTSFEIATVTSTGVPIMFTATYTSSVTSLTTLTSTTIPLPITNTAVTTVSTTTSLSCAAGINALSLPPLATETPNIEDIAVHVRAALNNRLKIGKNKAAGETIYPSQAASLGCSCLGIVATATVTTTTSTTLYPFVSTLTATSIFNPSSTSTTTQTTTLTSTTTSVSTLQASTISVTQTIVQAIPSIDPGGSLNYYIYQNNVPWDVVNTRFSPAQIAYNSNYLDSGNGSDPAQVINSYFDVCLANPPAGIANCNSLTYLVQGFLYIATAGAYNFSMAPTVSRYGAVLTGLGALRNLQPVGTDAYLTGPLSNPRLVVDPAALLTLRNNTLLPVSFVASTSNGRANFPLSMGLPSGDLITDLSSYVVTPCDGAFLP